MIISRAGCHTQARELKPKRDGTELPIPGYKRLTPREREIVQLLAEGRSSKEVAGSLFISTKTAETHRANIMRTLESHSITELVRYAVKSQIIEA